MLGFFQSMTACSVAGALAQWRGRACMDRRVLPCVRASLCGRVAAAMVVVTVVAVAASVVVEVV